MNKNWNERVLNMIISSYTTVCMLNPTDYTVKLGELGKPGKDTG